MHGHSFRHGTSSRRNWQAESEPNAILVDPSDIICKNFYPVYPISTTGIHKKLKKNAILQEEFDEIDKGGDGARSRAAEGLPSVPCFSRRSSAVDASFTQNSA